MNEEVILVNEQDKAIGTAEKLSAHQHGQLHRAFSIFLYRRVAPGAQAVEWLLQHLRADKSTCGGLLMNSLLQQPTPNVELLVS